MTQIPPRPMYLGFTSMEGKGVLMKSAKYTKRGPGRRHRGKKKPAGSRLWRKLVGK